MSGMKMIRCCTGIVFVLFVFSYSVSYGHEVWIEVGESNVAADGADFDVSLYWGHFPDDLDAIDSDAYALYVRRPDGEVEELELEPDEKRLTGSYVPPSNGQYVFWAVRRPSTFAPADGPITLSIQTAKTVHDVPAHSGTRQPVEKAVEIVPNNDLRGFKGGYAEFQILLDGQPAPNAAVSLYGTDGTELSTRSEQDGVVGFNIPSGGQWLVKANLRGDEAGDLDGEEYDAVSRTATLLLSSDKGSPQTADCEHCRALHGHHAKEVHTHAHAHGHSHDHGRHTGETHDHDEARGHLIDFRQNAAVFIAGCLIGGAAVLFVLGMKKRV